MKKRLFLNRINSHGNRTAVIKRNKNAVPVLAGEADS
jgi:hypothetical protein